MKFTLNGRPVDVAAHPMARLLDVLREECALTGTKEGCGEGECGACTVLIDGAPVCSCLVPFAHAASAELLTIEGLGEDHPLSHAFMDEVGAQCGICTPGMILAAVALGENPSLERIRNGLAGNLCRCTGYEAIYRAIRRAVDGRRRTADGGTARLHLLEDGGLPRRGGPPENQGAVRGDREHHRNAAPGTDSSPRGASGFGPSRGAT